MLPTASGSGDQDKEQLNEVSTVPAHVQSKDCANMKTNEANSTSKDFDENGNGIKVENSNKEEVDSNCVSESSSGLLRIKAVAEINGTSENGSGRKRKLSISTSDGVNNNGTAEENGSDGPSSSKRSAQDNNLEAETETNDENDRDAPSSSKRSAKDNSLEAETETNDENDRDTPSSSKRSAKDNSLEAETETETNDVQSNTNNNPEAATDTKNAPIKQETAEDEEEGGEEENGAHNNPSSSGTSKPVDIKPAVKIEKADASSTSRETCKFGIRCYRRNPMHRIEEAHPGDHDYRRPDYPTPPLGTPNCPYGNSCYRRNPTHFAQFSHPPNTDFKKNYKRYLMRQRKRQQSQQLNQLGSDAEDEYDLDDPFIDDNDLDSDFKPSSDEEEIDDDGDDDDDD